MSTLDADVMILCGGLGTRLRSVTDTPKTMVPVMGRPLLDMVVEHLQSCGLKRFIFCTGYKGDVIEEYFTSSLRVRQRSVADEASLPTYLFSEEKEPLGTAGALKLAEPLVRSKTVIALNGDSYCAMDYQALLAFHHSKKAAATLAVRPAEGRVDGGYVTLDGQSQIVNFAEKNAAASRFLSMGIYAFKRQVLDMIPSARKVSLEVDVFPSLAGKGCYAYQTREPLYDIGTPERLETFLRAVESRKS